MRQERAPENVAGSWNNFLVRGDATKLYEVAFPVERDHYRLSASELLVLQERFFAQKVAGTRWIESERKSMRIPGEFGDEPIGTTRGNIQLPSGKLVEQYATAYPEDGSGHIRFADALLDAWEIEKMKELDRALTLEESLDTWTAGIKRDRALLESLGIDGTFLDVESGGTFNSWDNAIARIKAIREQVERTSATGAGSKDLP
jgi:hypothetical protein